MRLIGFSGFTYKRVRSLKGKWRLLTIPQIEKRTALIRKLKDIFRRFKSQPAQMVINCINPVYSVCELLQKTSKLKDFYNIYDLQTLRIQNRKYYRIAVREHFLYLSQKITVYVFEQAPIPSSQTK